jgi:transposase-like protein
MEARTERAREAEGRWIDELCAEHAISQAQCYQWRDQFLAGSADAVEPAGHNPGSARTRERRLESLVGGLVLGAQNGEEALG